VSKSIEEVNKLRFSHLWKVSALIILYKFMLYKHKKLVSTRKNEYYSKSSGLRLFTYSNISSSDSELYNESVPPP